MYMHAHAYAPVPCDPEAVACDVEDGAADTTEVYAPLGCVGAPRLEGWAAACTLCCLYPVP